MKSKLKVPTIIRVGGNSNYKLDNTNPLDNESYPWMINGDLNEAIKKASKSFKKVQKKHREIELHEVKDIGVYTKHQGDYVKYKPVKL